MEGRAETYMLEVVFMEPAHPTRTRLETVCPTLSLIKRSFV